MTRKTPGDPRQTLGRRGEREAEEFLRRAGLRVIERRFRLRCGEIDLVAIDGDLVVFIEVKTRGSGRFGGPFEAVDVRKRRRVTEAARSWLAKRRITDTPMRFDVVGVFIDRDPPTIELVRGAFDAGGRW